MIRAEVVGNVGKQPELKQTKAGKSMVRFSVASTKKQEGKEPVTSWINVLAFDEMADVIAEKVSQGDRVLVTGRLEVEKWTNKEGVEQTTVNLLADDCGVSLRFPKRGERAAGKGDAWEGGF
jgi:single-strand DNA-binding protein